jgi:hypothetical protein
LIRGKRRCSGEAALIPGKRQMMRGGGGDDSGEAAMIRGKRQMMRGGGGDDRVTV